MDTSNDLIMKYQEQAILTMSRGELIVKLYDEVLKNLKYGSMMYKQDHIEAAKKCTKKCKDILNYLIAILDGKYSLSITLGKIYSFVIGQIIKADVKHDGTLLDSVIPNIQELRDAWAQAEKNLRTQAGERKTGQQN